MNPQASLLLLLLGFCLIALSSRHIGNLFMLMRLPLISGFLLTGILAGPYVLGMIPESALDRLLFIDQFSLAFIAFAAGSELYMAELRDRLRAISWQVGMQTVFTLFICATGVYFMSQLIPFMSGLSAPPRIAISLLAGSILVARSPASLIAIVNEVRARGPFTWTALGVTVLKDFVVIVLFAAVTTFADSVLTASGVDPWVLLLLPLELGLSVILGYILGKLLEGILGIDTPKAAKTLMVLLAGWAVFLFSHSLHEFTHDHFFKEILIEPLLVCMIGGFVVTNFTHHRHEFSRILFDIGPVIYIAFFTLTGASLELDVLPTVWHVGLALVLLRAVGIFLSTWGAGRIAGDPPLHNQVSWMVYITQAGVSLGLAKQVSAEFPELGSSFATLMIAVIVVNQVIGPPLCKLAFSIVGEARVKGGSAFDGVRDAVIFGLEGQALALARQLHAHDWEVKLASRRAEDRSEEVEDSDVDIHQIDNLDMASLEALDLGGAEAVITLLSDEENLEICELAYQKFGTRNIVVRLNDRSNLEKFREYGALIVYPPTAIVSLLEHFVRAPRAASLLLGMEESQDVADIEVRNPDLHHKAIRDLRLPLDTLVLAIRREGRSLVSHGYTRLERGDVVTIMGSPESLRSIALTLEAQHWRGVYFEEAEQ